MIWDPWLKGISIAHFSNIPMIADKSVNDFILDGQWQLPLSIPNALFAIINDISINEKSDFLWKGSSKPTFRDFLSHFYSHLLEIRWFKFIWHKKHALRYACFAWMTMIGKLKTADMLLHRGIQVFQECSFVSTLLKITLTYFLLVTSPTLSSQLCCLI
ncbi:hypothetical protein KFK09_021484 [Dendrobium nobile]|uniref:Reverse transcriptase zinc-binding domain-containing protein n=1 Tax=Dendrobium nobile TaxID=94219 RepID=A0A8T3APD2_DENNO|nr:hypothetical protein KFK09_021484 [Dendrobium nobile]